MAQTLPRFCPRCGAPPEGRRICANCGLQLASTEAEGGQPISPPSLQDNSGWSYETEQELPFPPRQPSPPGFSGRQPSPPGFPEEPPLSGQQYPRSGRPSQPGFSDAPSAWYDQTSGPQRPSQPGFSPEPGYPQGPAYPDFNAQQQSQQGMIENIPTLHTPGVSQQPRRPKKRSNTSALIGIVAVFLVLILLGVILVSLNIISLPGLGGNANLTQAPIKTTLVNSTLTYAGADITVLNAQQANNFVNDPNTKTDGMLRLNLQEKNTIKETVSFLYSQSAHLVLPGGKVISPTFAKARGGVAPGVTQTSFVDFAVPATTNLNQLTFRLGTDAQAQMDLPLSGSGQGSLAKYQPKTGKLTGVAVAYLQQGLTYAVTGVTSSYSIPGKQADKGMHFLALDISVDNTLAQTAIPGSPFDYLRLKTTNGLNTPLTTTLPISFDVGHHGTTGNVVFQAPQDATTVTLVLLGQPKDGIDQTQVTFQLP